MAEPARGTALGGEEPGPAAGRDVERLRVTASATGAVLSVDGGVAASFFAGDGSALVNLPPASDFACSSCITGSEVANSSLTLQRRDSLGTYCDDGGGADVLVSCMVP